MCYRYKSIRACKDSALSILNIVFKIILNGFYYRQYKIFIDIAKYENLVCSIHLTFLKIDLNMFIMHRLFINLLTKLFTIIQYFVDRNRLSIFSRLFYFVFQYTDN